MKNYYIYIIANKKNWTLYIWVTWDLIKRIQEHKKKLNNESFSAKYGCLKLVYYEVYSDVNDAITREKQLKNWRRDWKISLIQKENPTWRDLFDDIIQ